MHKNLRLESSGRPESLSVCFIEQFSQFTYKLTENFTKNVHIYNGEMHEFVANRTTVD